MGFSRNELLALEIGEMLEKKKWKEHKVFSF
jgi:hypothetical protein